MPIHTVTSAMATDRVMASTGRAVSERAAAAGPIIRLNISSAPTTGTVMLVARAMTSRNASSMRPEHDRDGHDRDGAEPEDGQHLAGADPEHLAEQQRVGLLRVLGAPADEQRADAEHHHEGQRGGHVRPGAAAEPGDAQRARH